MFHLVADVWRSYIVVEALRVVANHDLALTLALVLPFNELFFDVVVSEGLDERAEFFLLVVPGRPAGIHKDRRRDDGSEDLGLFELSLVDVKDD